MSLNSSLTNPQVLAVLGGRVRRYRLQQNLALALLAERAGVTPLTLQKLERGNNFTMETLVRVLRALGRLDQLDAFLPEPVVSPLALLAKQEQAAPLRRRASRRRG